MRTVRLKTPFSEEDVRKLTIGDIVYFSGTVFTCRSMFHKRYFEKNYLPPVDFKEINVMMHAGPVMQKTDAGWKLIAIAPTTSIRLEKFTPRIIEKLGIRAIIGKATMREGTAKAMQELGCVHLSSVGVPVGLLTKTVKKVVTVYDVEEMGVTEATWIYDVEDFGPFLVGIDTHGNNLFSKVDEQAKAKLPKAYAALNISKDYQYTEL